MKVLIRSSILWLAAAAIAAVAALSGMNMTVYAEDVTTYDF